MYCQSHCIEQSRKSMQILLKFSRKIEHEARPYFESSHIKKLYVSIKQDLIYDKYEVSKLSNETDSVAFDVATLGTWNVWDRQVNM